MDLPCKECIVLAICIRLEHRHMFSLLNILGKRCSLIHDYLMLVDIDIEYPEMNASREEKDIFNCFQNPRIAEIANCMRWDYNLDEYIKEWEETL